MAKKPGVMFYFEIRPCLKRLSAEEKGQLFEAILDYSECGVLPDFDGMLGIAWDFIQPRLDKDEEAYVRTVQQRQYAVYVRESKKRGTEPMAFDEWLALSENDLHRDASDDIGRYPTTTTTAASAANSNAISASATASTPATVSVSASNAISTTSSSCRTAAAKPRGQLQQLIFLLPRDFYAYAQSQAYDSS